MNTPDIKPIKRSAALAPLSREHHDTLLMAWKVRRGIAKGIMCGRIIKYCEWFYSQHMLAHFKVEEQWIPGILNAQDVLLLQMIDEHRQIKEALHRLSEKDLNCTIALEGFAKLVTDHVRFEERSLFNHVESIATKEQLEQFYQNHASQKLSEWMDPFWLD